MVAAATKVLIFAALVPIVGCGGSGGSAPATSSGRGSSGSSTTGGATTGGATTGGVATGSGTSGSSSSGAAGAHPPSCAALGPGLSDCGQPKESCCASPMVAGGTFNRTYMAGDADAGVADPASVSNLWLDKYD